MAESKQPSQEHYARHYPVVMQCAGLTEGDGFERVFDRAIRTIFGSYWIAHDQVTIAGINEAFEQYAKGQAIVREALRSLGPILGEIKFAAKLQEAPESGRLGLAAAHFSLRSRVSNRIAPNRDLDAVMDELERGINFLKDNPDVLARLLGRHLGDYRKDNEVALVIEPALGLLEKIGFRPSRKLTRKAFFNALFELIGIDKKRRPDRRSIDVIAGARRVRS
ncbi:hypothetical protein CQ12_37720 [Bradyrhizobium jicamae]|uniref:Uncharacterized protein n=1 Tax=Bradyrhizobium jicamae TaxID=280332 RepID=A0A0R3L3D5_9BRAD|nr:hypothetical protein [Bradyrhizobium jicamae]KRR02440.1 hypothetical protein CQ12_37720 [Bradyrhizobium jicamae]